MNKLVKRLCAIILMMVLGVGITAGYLHFHSDEESREQVSQVQAAYDYDLSDIDDGLTIYEIVPSIKCAKFNFNVGGSEIFNIDDFEGEDAYKTQDLTGILGYNFTFDFKMVDVIIKDSNGNQYNAKGEKQSGVFIPKLFNLEVFKREVLGLGLDGDSDGSKLVNFKIRDYITKLRDSSTNNDFITACNYTLANNYTVDENLRNQYEKMMNFKVTVKTFFVGYINEHPELLDKANLIIFTGKDIRPLGNVDKIEKYYTDEVKDQISQYAGTTSSDTDFTNDNDITAEVAYKLFENATDTTNRIPIIMHKITFDNLGQYPNEKRDMYQTYFSNGRRHVLKDRAYSNTGYNSNIYKLSLMIFQTNAYYFRYTFFDENIILDGDNLIFKVDDYSLDYWSIHTFREATMTEDGSYEYNDSETYSTQLTTNNKGLASVGMFYNSDNTLHGEIANGGWLYLTNVAGREELGIYYNWGEKIEAGAQDFFESKGNTSGNISAADAIAYLIFGEAFSITYEFNVLEVEPSSQYKVNDELVRKWIYRDEGIMNINITRMTMDELNSSKEDLGATYDMIYFGDNIGALSSTYNDSSLSQYIYFHTGDEIDTSGTLNAGAQRFSGNDVTVARKNDIINYANAGYPIIMANSIYNATKSKIDQQSNVYSLITAAETDTMKSNKQIVNEADFDRTDINIAKELFKHIKFERPGVSVEKDGFKQVNGQTYLEVSFRIGNLGPLEKRYNAYLYIDSDGDGVIEESKKNSTNTVVIASTAKVENQGKGTYTLECQWEEDYPLSAYYKIALAPTGTSSVYTSYQSTAQRSDVTKVVSRSVDKKIVRVLQIDEDTTNPTIDLTNETDYVASFAAGNKEELSNYNFKFERITTKEFEDLYTAEPYTMDDLIRDRLLNYDVIVFGFSENYPEISNANGALDNVIHFIKKNKSVIFTNSVLNYRENYTDEKTKEAYNTLRLLAGMTRYHDKSGDNPGDKPYILNSSSAYGDQLGFTYGTLLNGSKKSQSVAYNFASDSTSDTVQLDTSKVTRLNEGTVNHYPYEITVKYQKVAQKVNSTVDKTLAKQIQYLAVANAKSGSYQLDMEQTSLTGYYALNDSNENLAGTYSIQTNDMRNNYYLYHNNTVWYSGIGRTALTKETNEMEAKLFINTLVAAYEGTAQAPTVEFKNVLVDNKGNYKQFVNVDFGTKETSSDIIAYFKCIDSKKISTGMKVTIYVINNEQSDYQIKEIYDANVDEKADKYSILDQKISLGDYNIESEKIYAVKIPKDRMANNKVITLKVFADNKEAIGFGELQLLQRNLYDYD